MAQRPRKRHITLLTDFGLKDHFAGVMKGVIASIAPDAVVVDICHETPHYSIHQARFLLAQSWPYFPKGTIHVSVVDPEVGSARRPILVEAEGHLFLGPDNGLLTDLIAREKARVRHITNRRLFLKDVSATFHGRDVFAAVAAHLAAGLAPSKTGPLIQDAQRAAGGKHLRFGRRFWQGEIVHIDGFGNLITNLPSAEFPQVPLDRFALKVGTLTLRKFVPDYVSAEEGEPVVLDGSHGNLEIAVKQDSAARHLGVEVGAPVELEIW